jgi:hypothetical protein
MTERAATCTGPQSGGQAAEHRPEAETEDLSVETSSLQPVNKIWKSMHSTHRGTGITKQRETKTPGYFLGHDLAQ